MPAKGALLSCYMYCLVACWWIWWIRHSSHICQICHICRLRKEPSCLVMWIALLHAYKLISVNLPHLSDLSNLPCLRLAKGIILSCCNVLPHNACWWIGQIYATVATFVKFVIFVAGKGFVACWWIWWISPNLLLHAFLDISQLHHIICIYMLHLSHFVLFHLLKTW